MNKKIISHIVIIIAAAGFVTLSAGFYNAIKITSFGTSQVGDNVKPDNTPLDTPPSPGKNPNTVSLAVIGDSVARGAGDEKGKGFSSYIEDYLKNQTPKDISIDNVGVDGLQSFGLLEQLQDGKLNPLLSNADFVIMSIGGNDLRSIRSVSGITKDDEFKDREDTYLGNLKEILKIIRKNSKSAYIVFVGLYNPYEVGSSYDDTRLMNAWNYETEKLLVEDGRSIFIPTYDVFKFNLGRYIAPDGLHPNSGGYQAISSRIVKSIENILNK